MSFLNFHDREKLLLKTSERQIYLIDTYLKNLEYVSEEMYFAKENAGIINVHLQKAIEGLKNTRIRKEVNNWAESLIENGNKFLSKEDLLEKLSDFDDENMITNAEFFSIKQIFTLKSASVFIKAVSDLLEICKQKADAENWFFKKSGVQSDSVFFLEHAFKLIYESDDIEKKTEAEKRLNDIGKTEDDILRITSQKLSVIDLKMRNSVSVIHTVNDIDWMEAFQLISHTEKILMSDPGGNYPSLDEESKKSVRNEIEYLSEELDISERSIASKAAELVNLNRFKDICEVIYTDIGRDAIKEAFHFENKRIRKMVSDPDGKVSICLHISFSLVIFLIFTSLFGFLSGVILFPAIWSASLELIRFVSARCVKTHPLLSYKMDTVGNEQKTLVAIPALLSSVQTAKNILNQLLQHGIHEKSENIDFLLLGDYKDSNQQELKEDQEISDFALQMISSMNRSSDRTKYFYLQRRRTFNQDDGVWMGRERKRGAIEDLNRLLLNIDNRFPIASGNLSSYKNVITLDSDTKLLPGVIRKLIGTIENPLNKKYSVIQPRMESISFQNRSIFSKWMTGISGSDHYDICASDYFHDVTGEGLFSGKGIYNVERFFRATEGRFEDNTVLSHDMIEGILSKAAYDGKTVLFESFPNSIASYYKRLDRWTRGDWQLLYYLFGKLPLESLGRYKIVLNVLRSLKNASVLIGIILSVCLSSIPLLLLSLLAHFLPLFLYGIGAIRPLIMQFLLLPFTAFTEIRAAIKACVRIFFTKKKCLEWVTAADSEKTNEKSLIPGFIASAFLVPGLFIKGFFLISLMLGVIFAFGRQLIEWLDANNSKESMDLSDIAYLSHLSKSIWKYFEKYVPITGNGIPPDNVQIDPPSGVQKRTSPTNIGMYILSVIGASEAGMIENTEAVTRLKNTLLSLENMKTFKGLHFNWYDSESLEPLSPGYISSVDSGNLMAACVTARNFLSKTEESVSDRFQKLIDKMDIAFLYNDKRRLFRIGYDAENDILSNSHYDLYASEARILSYVSMAEKDIPIVHWKALSRPFVFINNRPVLQSWSGTMFEYMMPSLLLASEEDSLESVTKRQVMLLQKKKASRGIWGISESGFHAFDRDLNYQYQAFGISPLALSGHGDGNVYSPYSSILAINEAESETVLCLKRMQEAGLRGDTGFYEAIDMNDSENGRIVYSYMTHHQGMSFVAIVNYLTKGAVRNHFMKNPKEEALKPLLNEKPFIQPFKERFRKRNKNSDLKNPTFKKRSDDFTNLRQPVRGYNEGHLLFSNGATGYFDAKGQSFFRVDGMRLNAWHYGWEHKYDSLIPEIKDESQTAVIKRVYFASGITRYILSTDVLNSEVTFTIHPENRHLLIKAVVANNSEKTVTSEINSRFRLCLNDERSFLAHPVFSDLFVREEEIADYGRLYVRKDRETRKDVCFFYHLTDGEAVRCEDRSHSKHASLRRSVTIAPREKAQIYFELGMENERLLDFRAPCKEEFERAVILLSSQMNAHILFSGLRSNDYRHVDRMTAAFYTCSVKNGSDNFDPRTLWPLGISGEKPIMLCEIDRKSSVENLRRMIRAHEYYRFTGLKTPLVIVCLKEAEYFTPIKDEINRILLSSHLSGMIGQEDGAYLFCADEIDEKMLSGLRALSAFRVKRDFYRDAFPERIKNEKTSSLVISETLPVDKGNDLDSFNGYGGFRKDGSYEINIRDAIFPPRRWSNFLVNADFGVLVTECGISCIYYKNSAFGRITPFLNDVDLVYSCVSLIAEENGRKLSLFPERNAAVVHTPGKTVYRIKTENAVYETVSFVPVDKNILCLKTIVRSAADIHMKVRADVDFLMGRHLDDRRLTRVEKTETMTLARGNCDFTAFACFLDPDDQSGGMSKTITVHEGTETVFTFMIGVCDQKEAAVSKEDENDAHRHWTGLLGQITVDTQNPARDMLMNGFNKYQTIASRCLARFGPYQPGGAYGFRDQLQDMLSVMYLDSIAAREHILLCAERMFEKGDALHWWHMPFDGVRTRIRDDILFLSFTVSRYIALTGDAEILKENCRYLMNREIPENQNDLYCSFEQTSFEDSLYQHIMRAFRYSNQKGSHGLLLMGGGDWNDGMNKVGEAGRGESVWLSEFWIYAAKEFMPHAEREDRIYLENEIRVIKSSLETHAWDGEWYIRAYFDSGEKLGSKDSKECRIDLISQIWAVLIDLDSERSLKALESVRKHLIDKQHGIIRLLNPPFKDSDPNPGYISAYPEGVRENGGQYTHAAAWLVKAYAKMNMADEAWDAFDMLLPIQKTNTKEKADHYGGEPYVISADISYGNQSKGVCGWTWYTGSAAWAQIVLIEDLLGLKLWGTKVKMRALLKSGMDSVSVKIKRSGKTVTLVSGRNKGKEEDYVDIQALNDGDTVYFSSRE